MHKLLNMGLTIEVPPGMEVTILSPSAEDWAYIEDAYNRIVQCQDTSDLSVIRDIMKAAVDRCDTDDWKRASLLAVPQGFNDIANIAIMSVYDEVGIATIDLSRYTLPQH